MCRKQRAKETQGSSSLSVLGLSLLLGYGSYVIVVSLILEILMAQIQASLKRRIGRVKDGKNAEYCSR